MDARVARLGGTAGEIGRETSPGRRRGFAGSRGSLAYLEFGISAVLTETKEFPNSAPRDFSVLASDSNRQAIWRDW